MKDLPALGAENLARLRSIRFRGTVKRAGLLSLNKVNPSGNTPDDHGTGTTDQDKRYTGIHSPVDLPTIRERPQGS